MDRIYVMQLVRSFQVGEFDRRTFLKKAAVALGSVAAANALLAACTPRPAQAPPPVVEGTTRVASPSPQAPATLASTVAVTSPITQTLAVAPSNDADLIVERVEYPGAEGETLMGYLARPADGSPRPAVVVIQEWWGLNAHIEDVTRRFAREGFVAFAPDLYHGVVVSEPDEARKLVMELDMAEAVGEIRRAITHLQQQPFVAGSKVGIVGFCMGGRLALRTALAEPSLRATVAFYGSPLTPQEADRVTAPVLGLYGAADRGISEESIRAMEAALDKAGIENEMHIYPGAPHAFFNDTAASYRSEAAADAWARTLAWFRRYLT